MASKSTSSQKSSQLSPSSKVNFKCEDGIIAFNNTVALLEHTNDLYHPMLSFLSNYCIGLEIDIGIIIFSYLVHKLQNGKKNREASIYYNRFLSLIFEKLLGENYINDSLTFVKPHTISAASFQKPLALEVDLTSHMLKVAKLFQEPGQSLILSSEKVNANDGADSSLSRTTMQPITQPKAPTDLKLKKKSIPPSSKPNSSYKVRVIHPKKQVAETQHAEETVATAEATQSQGASESAEDQVNQPSTVDATKVLDQNVQEEVKESGLKSIRGVTFEQIMDEYDQKNKTDQEVLESPYDTESEIKFIKSFKVTTISGLLSDVSLCRHGYAVSSLMDTTYWSLE
ncbi:hypothetical protein Tco_1456937 [Tanacetum coccineum]